MILWATMALIDQPPRSIIIAVYSVAHLKQSLHGTYTHVSVEAPLVTCLQVDLWYTFPLLGKIVIEQSSFDRFLSSSFASTSFLLNDVLPQLCSTCSDLIWPLLGLRPQRMWHSIAKFRITETSRLNKMEVPKSMGNNKSMGQITAQCHWEQDMQDLLYGMFEPQLRGRHTYFFTVFAAHTQWFAKSKPKDPGGNVPR